MKKEQVLLVWELHPESVKFYLFDAGSHEAYLARMSSGFMINGGLVPDKHPIYELNELLSTVEPVSLDTLKYGLNIISVYEAGFFL